mmetsp:Transcript_48584/g.80560  ORF Transcript_48584/g.80560 Transcript_48584/m.80560 type:complete len:200 (+) Transcript_48584:1143-1742(+)
MIQPFNVGNKCVADFGQLGIARRGQFLAYAFAEKIQITIDDILFMRVLGGQLINLVNGVRLHRLDMTRRRKLRANHLKINVDGKLLNVEHFRRRCLDRRANHSVRQCGAMRRQRSPRHRQFANGNGAYIAVMLAQQGQRGTVHIILQREVLVRQEEHADAEPFFPQHTTLVKGVAEIVSLQRPSKPRQTTHRHFSLRQT